VTKAKDVRKYLEELEKTKEGRTEQVKEGLEIYISLWRRAMERGVIAGTDGVDDALAKIEKAGGMYVAAGE
jgi:hypothetical protein